MLSILDNVDLGNHALTEWTETRGNKLELHLELLLLNNSRNINLDLQVEHMVASHRLANFEEVLLTTTIEVINQEAAWVPIVLCLIKYFELNESGLSSLYTCIILILGYANLLRHVLSMRQVLD